MREKEIDKARESEREGGKERRSIKREGKEHSLRKGKMGKEKGK